MKIEVMMFAAAKENAGANRVIVESSEPMTARSIMQQLGHTYPKLKPLLASCRLAVDDQYVGDDFRVDPDSEVALIPPVSGG